ncbi:MAG: 50S ribosomal protein L3 [Phycisphaeraceae bacterium]|nr:50S ribosomal protein L3 [Phycisphaeraceae bacterium]
MAQAILGRKIGMTRLFDEQGHSVPVTVVQAGPCFVSQVKTVESDGYSAVQIAYEDIKPRRSTLPLIAHDAKAGLVPMRFHREFRTGSEDQFEVGQELTVQNFAEVKFVDVVGTSKGKGMQGVMKRHHFSGMEASHGVERKHRSPGSICSRSSNRGTGKPKKGIRMAGHMGADRVTVRSLPVIGIDKERNLLMVKGPVPGSKQGLLMIREAVRLNKSKAEMLKAS